MFTFSRIKTILKINILLIFSLFVSHFTFSQNLVTVYGNISHPKGEMVYIRYYEDFINYGEAIADSAELDKKGNFIMQFEWPAPYPATFYHGDEVTSLFICPNDSLRLTLDTKIFDETVVYSGQGADINNYLAYKTLKYPPIGTSVYKQPEKEFIHIADSARDVQLNYFEDYISKLYVGDPGTSAFLDMERANIVYSHAGNMLMYPSLNAYLNKSRTRAMVSPSYYSFLDDLQLDNPKAGLSYLYLEFLSDYVDLEVRRTMAKDTSLDAKKIKEDYIHNHLAGNNKEYVYAKWVYSVLTDDNDLANARELYKSFLIFSVNAEYKTILDEAFVNVERLSPGKMAPDFTLRDISGQLVSLNEFRGKVVYLDIWATWCGPCIMEIPALDTLITEMASNDIVFLSVSIDEDEKHWKKFVKGRKMKGVHVISTGSLESSFSKLYNVNGIPQYLIIDQNGRIVDSNAKRPSGGVKEDLEKLIGNGQ